jgi:hypothetical protein
VIASRRDMIELSTGDVDVDVDVDDQSSTLTAT